MQINPETAKYFSFESVTSTNDFARELLSEDELVVVSALHQSLGRGRNINKWYGSYGNNIYLSIGIKHKSDISTLDLAVIQAVGSLAVKNTLSKLTNQDLFQIKYPNDVYAFYQSTHKKISGILIEHSFAGSECISSVIGIGINVNENSFPLELQSSAVSLSQIGITSDIQEIKQEVINNFFDLLTSYDDRKLFDIWKKELNLENKDINVLGKDKKYRFSKFFDDGRIELIDNNNNKITIDNGDSVRYSFD